MRTVTNRNHPVQVLVNRDRATRERAAEPALLQLPTPVADRHGVVLAHHALGLEREHPLQVGSRGPSERGSFFRRGYGEALVELPDIAFAEKSVRTLHIADAG